MVDLEWEEVSSRGSGFLGGKRVSRAPVPGGWLVVVLDNMDGTDGTNLAMAFVPDPDNEWE